MSFILVGLAWPVVARDLPIYASFGGVYSDTDTTASTDTQVFTTFPPPEVPLDGLPFDDDNLGWSAALGYQFLDFFAVELGYMDLGTVESDAFTLTVPGSTLVPRPAIESTALFLSAQFQYPLTDRLRATWHVGIADAEFEADGSITLGFAVIRPLPPFTPFPQPEPVDLPFGDPDDELGYFFGFGMSWRFNPHLDIEVRYSRQDLEVLEFDTFGIRLIGRL